MTKVRASTKHIHSPVQKLIVVQMDIHFVLSRIRIPRGTLTVEFITDSLFDKHIVVNNFGEFQCSWRPAIEIYGFCLCPIFETESIFNSSLFGLSRSTCQSDDI